MSPELVKLHLSQLQKAIEKSKTNIYADNRKQNYHDNVLKLFTQLNALDFDTYSPSDLNVLKSIVDFCFVSVEFLDSSTLVNIPHEIVYCIEKALNEWVGTDPYIIVTSLQNDLNGFSFNPLLSLNEPYYDFIKTIFGIEFKNRLIQINLPKYLAQDYLANVVLYHELGHFVDLRFKITERLSLKLSLNDKERTHCGEYFSDIFASQYIGEASNSYLNYIAYDKPDSYTHPSTNSRISMVCDFLNGIDNPLLDELKNAVKIITGKELENRRTVISDNDFTAFVPSVINSESELHSVFEIGWNLWKTKISKFEANNMNTFDKYTILNNLIEKSISNYMVLEKWNKACI